MTVMIPTDSCLTQWAHQVLTQAEDVEPRQMFGHPAFFVGRRMFACVYKGNLALKLPARQVSSLIAAATAGEFRPHGKPKMREWCEVPGRSCNGSAAERLLLEAWLWARLGHPADILREVANS